MFYVQNLMVRSFHLKLYKIKTRKKHTTNFKVDTDYKFKTFYFEDSLLANHSTTY